MPWRVLCRHSFSSAMRSARSLRGSGGAGASAGGASAGGAVPGPARGVQGRARDARARCGRRVLRVGPRLRRRRPGRRRRRLPGLRRPAAGCPARGAGAGHRGPGCRTGRRCPRAAGLRAWVPERPVPESTWITGRMYSRAVWPRLRASLPSFPGTVMTRLSPSTTTSEPETPSPLTRALMICCACANASRLGARAVRRAGGQRDAGAALKVDAELGCGLLVAGEKHQQIDADQQ